MLLRGVGITRAVRSTVILGAGASRGASFVTGPRQVLPPLDADLFRQAQRLDEASFVGGVRELVEFVREEYGATKLPTLETVFTQLQAFDQFLRQFTAGPGRRSQAYRRQLGHLLEVIAAVFRAAFEGQECVWHDRIAQALRKGDSIVSFNYDALIDLAVSRWCQDIWKADRGYGVSITQGVGQWTTPKMKPGRFPEKEFLRLLKPHGSLHSAAIDHDKRYMRLRPDAYAGDSAAGSIIPPTWDKTALTEWPWNLVWRQAVNALRRTRCLIVIGYSVPQTDLTSQALIRSSLSGGDLRLLIVANPDPDARARVVDLARGAVRSHTRIFEVGTLADFASLLDETPLERNRRELTSRQLRRLDRLASRLDSRVGSLADELESHDLDGIESRLGALERLESRISDLEDQLNG